MPNTYSALVPLRGGSQSIPLKNIKPFFGRPLCAWAIGAALATPGIEAVWISTDNDEIENVARSISSSVRIHRRPAHLGGHLTTTEDVMIDWVTAAAIETSHIVTLQATSPQTSSTDLAAAIAAFEQAQADSLVTGIRTHRFFWSDDGRALNYDPGARPMRQQWAGTFMENGAFYISSRDRLLHGQSRLHGKIAMHTMDPFSGIELDEPEDWGRLEAEFAKVGHV